MSYRPVCLFIAQEHPFGYSANTSARSSVEEHHIDIVGAGSSILPVRTKLIFIQPQQMGSQTMDLPLPQLLLLPHPDPVLP